MYVGEGRRDLQGVACAHSGQPFVAPERERKKSAAYRHQHGVTPCEPKFFRTVRYTDLRTVASIVLEISHVATVEALFHTGSRVH
jgi:hypothetical protein